jgi:hypothetical protein
MIKAISFFMLLWVSSLPFSAALAGASETISDTEKGYVWERTSEQSLLLSKDGKPLLQYEHPVFDNNNREETYKPFHHVFDPETGKIITKGPGGRYTHHRGIFYGYNKISVNGGENIDIWHNRNGEHSQHQEVVAEFTDERYGGHIVKILWKDTDGKPFATETRILRASYDGKELFIDFHSTLASLNGATIELNGDRQHAGVQFRAANEVDANAEETFFIRPARLNHVPEKTEIEGDNMIDLNWNAMVFTLDEKQYTVAYLSHPSNPEGAQMSERKYGRFGEFFPYTLTPEKPLIVQYRFVISSGEPPKSETIQHWYENYVTIR